MLSSTPLTEVLSSYINQIFYFTVEKGLLKTAPTTANIPLITNSQRTSPSIPLRSLRSQSQSASAETTQVFESASEKGGRRSSFSSTQSVESDFSLWTDTGDLAEQLADVEDPLQGFSKSFDRDFLRRTKGGERMKQLKSVHYSRTLTEDHQVETDKESIIIPQPLSRRVPRIERFLAAIMSPNNRQTAQIHGFVGKPLL